jgi:hypothetical protein
MEMARIKSKDKITKTSMIETLVGGSMVFLNAYYENERLLTR